MLLGVIQVGWEVSCELTAGSQCALSSGCQQRLSWQDPFGSSTLPPPKAQVNCCLLEFVSRPEWFSWQARIWLISEHAWELTLNSCCTSHSAVGVTLWGGPLGGEGEDQRLSPMPTP